mgnify:CR=1 FL=1
MVKTYTQNAGRYPAPEIYNWLHGLHEKSWHSPTNSIYAAPWYGILNRFRKFYNSPNSESEFFANSKSVPPHKSRHEQPKSIHKLPYSEPGPNSRGVGRVSGSVWVCVSVTSHAPPTWHRTRAPSHPTWPRSCRVCGVRLDSVGQRAMLVLIVEELWSCSSVGLYFYKDRPASRSIYWVPIPSNTIHRTCVGYSSTKVSRRYSVGTSLVGTCTAVATAVCMPIAWWL